MMHRQILPGLYGAMTIYC